MICQDCKSAGELNSGGNYGMAASYHKHCKGDCGCQHKTGPGWFVRRGVKTPLMQTQSP